MKPKGNGAGRSARYVSGPDHFFPLLLPFIVDLPRSIKLNKPVVGLASSPDGGGYWLVASDGGIFNYGDAGFFGSTGSLKLNQPVVGMAPGL
jgi:hypothetical protein